MPGFDRDQVAIDNTVENRQLGSIMLTDWLDSAVDGCDVGRLLLPAACGTARWFWPIWLGIEGVIGFVLVIMGTRYRHAVGATRLGQRDMARTDAAASEGRCRR